MYVKEKILIAIIVSINMTMLNNCMAQDVHFSQYNYSPLTLNPACAGVFADDMRAIVNYRNQWAEVASPYRTFAFSCDLGLNKRSWDNGFLGAGLQFFNDQAGDAKLATSQINLSLSGIKKLNENNILSAGIQGGILQRKFDGADLKWANQWDGMGYNSSLSPGESTLSGTLFRPDFSAGILWNYSRGDMYATANDALHAHAGIAMFHANRPNISFGGNEDRLNSKYIFHGGLYLGIKNSNMSLLPDFMLSLQGPSREIIAGLYFKQRIRENSKYTGFIKSAAILFGGHYRFGDAVIPSVQLEMAKYALGISYDVNTSGLRKASSGLGGIEISLRYIIPNPFAGKTTTTIPKYFNKKRV